MCGWAALIASVQYVCVWKGREMGWGSVCVGVGGCGCDSVGEEECVGRTALNAAIKYMYMYVCVWVGWWGRGSGSVCVCVGVIEWVNVGIIVWVRKGFCGTALIAAVKYVCMEGGRGGVCVGAIVCGCDCVGGCGCSCVRKKVCRWDSLDCCHKVCVGVCVGKERGRGVCGGVTVWVWV